MYLQTFKSQPSPFQNTLFGLTDSTKSKHTHHQQQQLKNPTNLVISLQNTLALVF